MSHVARGGILRVNPYPQGKQACEQVPRGTFDVDDFRLYTAWTCTWPGADLGPEELDLLRRTCLDAGGDWGGAYLPEVAGMVGFRCIDMPDTP